MFEIYFFEEKNVYIILSTQLLFVSLTFSSLD